MEKKHKRPHLRRVRKHPLAEPPPVDRPVRGQHARAERLLDGGVRGLPWQVALVRQLVGVERLRPQSL